VFALADEGSERRRADLAGADVERGPGVSSVVEEHPAADVLPLEVTLRTHARSQLCHITASTTCQAPCADGIAIHYYPRESEGMCFHQRWFVCVCVCVCVCLSVTTITKKIVDGFTPNFM